MHSIFLDMLTLFSFCEKGPQRAKRMVSEFEKTGAAPAGMYIEG